MAMAEDWLVVLGRTAEMLVRCGDGRKVVRG